MSRIEGEKPRADDAHRHEQTRAEAEELFQYTLAEATNGHGGTAAMTARRAGGEMMGADGEVVGWWRAI
jgi:hypothetical protein